MADNKNLKYVTLLVFNTHKSGYKSLSYNGRRYGRQFAEWAFLIIKQLLRTLHFKMCSRQNSSSGSFFLLESHRSKLEKKREMRSLFLIQVLPDPEK